MNKVPFVFVVVGVWCGCQTPSNIIAADPNDLGVSTIEIDRTRDGDHQTLSIHGQGADGQDRALVTLRTGTVYVESDWGDPVWTAGSDLTIAVGAQQNRTVIPGVEPHQASAPPQPALASFVRLPAVAAMIEKEARITFAPAGDERAYSATACSGSNFSDYKSDGTPLGAPTQCCDESTNGTQWFKIKTSGKLGTRAVGSYACSLSNSGPGTCTGTVCTFGPCKGSMGWYGGGTGTGGTGPATATVFTPTNFPTACGYDDDGTGPDTGTPQNYTNQAVKTFTAPASCGDAGGQFTYCYVGAPMYGDKALTFSVTSDGLGSYVTSSLSSNTLTGNMSHGSFTGYLFGGAASGTPPAQSVTLTVHPALDSTWHWTGYCNSTSSTTCVIPMSVARTQAITFAPGCPTGCFMNESACCQQNACFAAGTQVAMADGTTRDIEAIKIGDYVMAYDTTLGRTKPSRVTRTFVHDDNEGTVLINGTVRATPNHPFYANGEWVEAGKLSAGDVLVGLVPETSASTGEATATPMTLGSLQSMPGVQTVYNLEVDTLHDYFAGGVLVHNKQPVCNCEP